MKMSRMILMLGLVLAVAACSRDRDITLTRLKKPGEGPDEFSIVPGKPLEPPKSYSELPPPMPGAPNRTDTNPKAEGIAALGGNPHALESGGIPPADVGLVKYVARHGADPTIRQKLAVEDAQIRRDYGRRNLLRIGPRDDYTEAYKKMWLDPYLELQRLRRAGVRVPSAPPPPS